LAGCRETGLAAFRRARQVEPLRNSPLGQRFIGEIESADASRRIGAAN
jgi:hypothetical protein